MQIFRSEPSAACGLIGVALILEYRDHELGTLADWLDWIVI